MPRESSKCREWEKERRNRLNEAFQQLCKLLPCYDPSVNTSKLDILRNACKLIEELQEKIKELTCDNNEEKTKKIRNDEIRKLQERLRKLLSKNEQLCCLLRDAKITIPVGCGIVKKFRSHLYWSNRFTPEQVKILQDKEQENSKENNENKLKKIANKNKTNNGTPKHRKVIVNRTENKKLRTTKKKKSDNQTKPNCVIVLSKQPTVTQPCYVITNAPSNGILTNTSTVLTNSNLLTTPLVSTNIKNSNNKTVTPVQTSTLGPGTLILANGTIVPVLPPPPAPPPSQQTILPTQLLTTQSNPTVILLPKITTNQSKTIETTKTIKTLTRIKPKYCLTRTTQANKVPIPALTSRYSNNEVVLKKTDNKTFKNDKKKLEKSNESGEKRKSIDIDKENCKKSKIDGDSGNKNGDSNEKSESNPQVVNDIVKENKSQKNSVGNTENSKDLLKTSEIDKENLPTSTVATTITKNTITESIDGNKENNNVEFSGNSENRNVVEMLEKSVNEATSTISTTTITTTTTTTTIETVPVKTITTTTTTGTAAITTISIKTTQQQDVKNLELNLNHSELSNDIFATLQVPSGCQNPESTSPTAAFLLAFPLVSSLTGVKVTEVTEEDNNTVESQRGTPTLLQIGTMDTTKPTQSDNLTPNLLNLDNLSFFSTNHFYNYDNTASTTTTTTTITTTSTSLATNKNVNLLENSGNNGTVLTDCQLKTTPTTSTTITTIPTTTKKNYTNYKSSYNYNNFDDLTTPTTKITTYSTIIKNYPDPLYTNSNTYNYNYNDNNFNQNYYKNITRTDNRNYYSLNYENYTDYRKNDLNFNTNYYSTTTTTTTTTATTTTTTVVTPTTQFIKEKFLGNSNKNKNDRPPVNWMTTPDYNLPQFTKDNDFYIANTLVTTTATTTTTYFSTINQNSNNLINNNDNNQENKKNLDLSLNYHHHHYHPHHQKNDIEDNQFSWSPTKLPQFFEPTTHSFTTLPTLVGDLSLNNSITTTTTNFLNDTKTDTVHKFNSKKDNNRRQIGNNKTYENQSNFLSVSQLVDHNKNESIPARTTNRRNSGNRSSKKVHQQQQQKSRSGGNNKAQDKEQNNKNQLKQINYNIQENNDLYCDSTKNHRNLSKNYSAEALISHQLPQSRQNYSTTTTNSVSTTTTNKLTVPPPFLPENPILPYFPSVDLPTQDNNYGIQQNQNYSHHHHHHHHHHPQTFGHNFSTSFQNNNYTSNSFIPPPPPPPPPPPAPSTTTSSYLSTNSFIHDMGTHDYTDNLNLFPPTTTITSTSSSAQNKDKSYNKNRILGNNQQNICSINNNLNNNGSINNIGNKKRKKQNEMNTNLPGFVDFSFFSMPGTINSPILPDDFHTGFLTTPTPQLYPCKNPLYPTKQNDLTTSTLLPPPLPPVPPNNNNNNNNTSSGNINNNNGRSNVQHPEISPSINNAGTSLTNFNLSTIFPEINNKGVLSEPYLEPRIKDHTVRNYNSTAQVSFNDKPSFSFSYINSTSQSYNQ